MAFVRLVEGLLFEDNFQRANGLPGANWEEPNSLYWWSNENQGLAPSSYVIEDNELRCKTVNPDNAPMGRLICTGFAPQTEVVTQITGMDEVHDRQGGPPTFQAANSGSSVLSRWFAYEADGEVQADFINHVPIPEDPEDPGFVPGGYIDVYQGYDAIELPGPPDYDQPITGGFPLNTWIRQKGWVNVATGLFKSYIEGTGLWIEATVPYRTADPGYSGVTSRFKDSYDAYPGGLRSRFSHFAAYKSNTVRVTNVPIGFTVQIGSIVSDPADIIGDITLDIEGMMCPITSLSVLDGSDTVVETYTPEGGIWGGDEISFSYFVGGGPGWLSCPVDDPPVYFPLPEDHVTTYKYGDPALITQYPAAPPGEFLGYTVGHLDAISVEIDSGRFSEEEAAEVRIIKRSVYSDVLIDYLDPFPLGPSWLRKDAPLGILAAWLEVWSDVEEAGGVRQWFIRDAIAVTDYMELGGRELLQFRIPRTSPAWQHIDDRKVIRVVYDDLTWDEWRVIRTGQSRSEKNALIGDVEAESMLYDLNRSMFEEVEVNGIVSHVYYRYGLLPGQHADEIMSTALPHLQVGTIEPTAALDMEEEEVTTLALMRRLADSTNSELEVARELDSTMYNVNLRTEIGSTDSKPRLVLGRNLRQVRLDGDSTEQINRVYPFGINIEGARWSMAEAIWEVTAKVGTRLTIGGGPIAFDDQLNGLFIELSGTTVRVEIVDCFYQTQEIDVTTAIDFEEGDLIHFRRDNSGTRLTYLDHPISIARYGLYPAPVYRDDIPGIDNLLGNPFLEVWEAGEPLRWYAVGAATITMNQDKLYKKYGSASAHIVAGAAGIGLESDWVPVVPTAERPYGSLQTVLFLLSGSVELELVVSDGITETTYPAADEATTTELRTWVENLMIKGIDLLADGATQIKARILSVGGAAEWYIDAAQFTQTSGGAETFYSGLASNDIWRAGNRTLRENAYPARSFEVMALDLYRIDPARFKFDVLKRGVTAVIEDEYLVPTGEEARITSVRRDLLVPARTEVTLATRPADLTQIVARPLQRVRRSSAGLPPVPQPAPNEPGTTENPNPMIANIQIATTTGEPFGSVQHVITWEYNDAIVAGNLATPGRYTVEITETIALFVTEPDPAPTVVSVIATQGQLIFDGYWPCDNNQDFSDEFCQFHEFTYAVHLLDNGVPLSPDITWYPNRSGFFTYP